MGMRPNTGVAGSNGSSGDGDASLLLRRAFASQTFRVCSTKQLSLVQRKRVW